MYKHRITLNEIQIGFLKNVKNRYFWTCVKNYYLEFIPRGNFTSLSHFSWMNHIYPQKYFFSFISFGTDGISSKIHVDFWSIFTIINEPSLIAENRYFI